MKIIFLDIDGVMISARTMEEHFNRTGISTVSLKIPFDPIAVTTLKEIVNTTNAKIVITSTWRRIMTIEQLMQHFAFSGWPDVPLLDVTPTNDSDHRAHEIQTWLDEWADNPLHEPVESFVILDDGADMDPLLRHFVRTTWADGLLPHHARFCLRVLDAVFFDAK